MPPVWVPIVGAMAAIVAILANFSKIVGWLRSRFIKLEITTSLGHAPQGPVVTVRVRNVGKRDAVLTGLGIARCEIQAFHKPVSRAARFNSFPNGERLQ